MKNFKGYLKGFTLLAIFILLIVLTGCKKEDDNVVRALPAPMVQPSQRIVSVRPEIKTEPKNNSNITKISPKTNTQISQPTETKFAATKYVYIKTNDQFSDVVLFKTKDLKVFDKYIEWHDANGSYHQHFLQSNLIVHVSDRPLNQKTQYELFGDSTTD